MLARTRSEHLSAGDSLKREKPHWLTEIYKAIGISFSQRIIDRVVCRINLLVDKLVIQNFSNRNTIESSATEILRLIDVAKQRNQISSSVADAITIHVKNVLELEFDSRDDIEKGLFDIAKIAALNSETSVEFVSQIQNVADVEPKKYLKDELQALRNQVREMVREEKPLFGIDRYRGKNIDGAPYEFFIEKYGAFTDQNNEVLFASDLQVIDARLLRAIRNDFRGQSVPLKTVSDLSAALVEGRFTDGSSTRARVATARWRMGNRESMLRM